MIFDMRPKGKRIYSSKAMGKDLGGDVTTEAWVQRLNYTMWGVQGTANSWFCPLCCIRETHTGILQFSLFLQFGDASPIIGKTTKQSKAYLLGTCVSPVSATPVILAL